MLPSNDVTKGFYNNVYKANISNQALYKQLTSKTMSSTQVSRLESLPSELFLSIAEYAGFDGRLSLSAANSSCRSLLLQSIFRTLRVTSDEEGANEVLAIAKKIGANVHAISFHGTAGPNEIADEDDEDSDTLGASTNIPGGEAQEQVLPQAAAALLRGEHLPNATTLIIHFDFDFDGADGTWDSRDDLSDGASMDVFTVQETSRAMVVESEAEFPWRRLMSQTWAAASQNTHITSLVVRDLIPKAATAWFEPQWARFLGQIELADIQLWGSDNGAGWEVGTLEGYMYFVSHLDSYFLTAMTHTTKLRLSCYEHGPLGSDLTDVTDTMALRPPCLPRLEVLRLEYALLCPELAAFLIARASTLRHVALYECFASSLCPRDGDHVRMTWATFFSALRESSPTYHSFAVTSYAAPPPTFNEWQKSRDRGGDGDGEGKDADEAEGEEDPEEQERDNGVRSVRAELASDPGKRLFLYAKLTEKYGDRWPDEEAIIEHFWAGRDMEEFGKLMGVVGGSGGV